MKQLLKKFKNFRLTALIEGIVGIVSGLSTIVILILYQTNLLYVFPSGKQQIETGFFDEPIVGMVFFLSALLAIIFAIVVVYGSYPFVFKKEEKLDPKPSLTWFGVTCAVFSIVTFVFSLLMIAKPGSQHSVGILIAAIFLLLAALVQLLMIVPALLVRVEDK